MKRILLSVIVILAVASLATVGTFAYFSDSESSQGNTLQMGSLDLKLADPSEWFGDDPLGDSVTQTWYLPDSMPGDVVTGELQLANYGTTPADHVDIDCVNQNFDPLGGWSDKDTVMIIKVMTYNSQDLLALLTPTRPDGKITLHDLEQQGLQGLDPPGGPSVPGGPLTLSMTIEFDPAAVVYQGHKTIMTLIIFMVN